MVEVTVLDTSDQVSQPCWMRHMVQRTYVCIIQAKLDIEHTGVGLTHAHPMTAGHCGAPHNQYNWAETLPLPG